MPDTCIICHKTEIIDGTVSYSETFDPDDPTLMDSHPSYGMDKPLGDRPPTPIQQREVHYKLKASRKTEHASIKSNLSAITVEGKPYGKYQYLTKT
jgi:hypothetical protein